jgi:hypothetical protein
MTFSQTNVIKRISVSLGQDTEKVTWFEGLGFKSNLKWILRLAPPFIRDIRDASASWPPLNLEVIIVLEDDCFFAAEVAWPRADLLACRLSFQQDGSVSLCWAVDLEALTWAGSQELKLDQSLFIQRAPEIFLSLNTSLVSNIISRTFN